MSLQEFSPRNLRRFWIELEEEATHTRAAKAEQDERIRTLTLSKSYESLTQKLDRKEDRSRIPSWIERTRDLERMLTNGNLSDWTRGKCQRGLERVTQLINSHLLVSSTPATEQVAELH